MLDLRIEIPKEYMCVICGEKLTKANFHIKYGQRYCSIECQDLGEEKNQGDDNNLNNDGDHN